VKHTNYWSYFSRRLGQQLSSKLHGEEKVFPLLRLRSSWSSYNAINMSKHVIRQW
jgi:hypothetical protein